MLPLCVTVRVSVCITVCAPLCKVRMRVNVIVSACLSFIMCMLARVRLYMSELSYVRIILLLLRLISIAL